MDNKICKLLGIEYPIIQGAMAWVSDASLASAVSNAGGLGVIAGGNAPAELVHKEILKAKELTDKPFGVNVMLLSEHAEEVVDVICKEKVKVVTTGAGNPAKYMERFKENDMKVLPVVPSVAIAKKMQRIGADAVIIEGMEAGGHIGKLTTMVLVPQVCDVLDIPVVAAGGIGDGRGVAAVFMLGAEAAQLGTRFLTAKECTVHQNYKDFVLKAKDIDSVVTGTFTGHPVRVLKNNLALEMEKMGKNITDNLEDAINKFNELGTGALRKAVVEGDVVNGSVMAGQIAGLIKKEQSCHEIITELMEEYLNVIKNHKVKI